MLLHIQNFLTDDMGQDLAEYALLVAFLCTVIFGLAGSFHDSVAAVTNLSTTQLNAANAAVH